MSAVMASQALLERMERPEVLIGLMSLALLLFAFSAQTHLAESRRKDAVSARLVFTTSCILLVAAIGAGMIGIWAPDLAITGGAVLSGALVGLLLIAVLGTKIVYVVSLLTVVAICGALATTFGADRYLLGESRTPYILPWAYTALPASVDRTSPPRARDVALVVCDSFQVAVDGNDCGVSTPGSRIYRLRQLRHDDVGFGRDVWYFVFRAAGVARPFLYIVSGNHRYIGRTADPIGRDLRLERNRVARLTGFPNTKLAAGALDPMATKAGLAWAARGGVDVRVEREPRIWVPIVDGAILLAILVGLAFALWHVADRRQRKRGPPGGRPTPKPSARSRPAAGRRSRAPLPARRSG